MSIMMGTIRVFSLPCIRTPKQCCLGEGMIWMQWEQAGSLHGLPVLSQSLRTLVG
jgi:hypothetical protein